MRHRLAAQSLIEKILAEYEARPPQSRLARIFGIAPIPPDELTSHVSALGERYVARTLAALPSGWHAFNSIPIGFEDGDIDHVVVGPGGVFAINTQRHSGKSVEVGGKSLLVDGRREPDVSFTASAAERLTKVLRVRLDHIPAAHAVIALVDTKRFTIKEQPRTTTVLDARRLIPWLIRQPESLDAEVVTDVAAVLDDPATWRPMASVDRLDLASRFDALMRRVRRARVVQAVWVIVLALVLFGGCLVFFTHTLTR